MRTRRATGYHVVGAKSVLRAISQPNGSTKRPNFRFVPRVQLGCDQCNAQMENGRCTNGCDDRPDCPICHAGKWCECTSDDRYFYELARGKVEPGESIENAMRRVRNEYNAGFAQDALHALEQGNETSALVRKYH